MHSGEKFSANQGKFSQAGRRPEKWNDERRKKIRCWGVLTCFKHGRTPGQEKFSRAAEGTNRIGTILIFCTGIIPYALKKRNIERRLILSAGAGERLPFKITLDKAPPLG